MKTLLDAVLEISIDAGSEILDVYENEISVETKGDGSPLTQADQRAHKLIQDRLQGLNQKFPVLSEESVPEKFEQRRHWDQFWLVDPLDGTKEFIKRNGEFTVNIALIRHGTPVIGVVHTPVTGISHFAAHNVGAFKADSSGTRSTISTRPVEREKVVMVASRSHAGAAVEAYRSELEKHFDTVDTAPMGSSLKICLVAEGAADIYPRLGPTSEWDTAAAQCVLATAGGAVTTIQGEPLEYNKADILNPWFLAAGDTGFDWTALVSEPTG